MAGIILVERPTIDDATVDSARNKFKKKSFQLKEEKFVLGKYELYYYHDLFGEIKKDYQNPNGDCFFLVGTLVVEGKTGIDALKILENRLNHGQKLEDMVFSGGFILIAYRKGELLISRDLFGGINCYTNPTKTWLTTNFLSALDLNVKNRFSKNELLESILFGFVFGDHTVIEGIFLLQTTQVFNLTQNSSLSKNIRILEIEGNLSNCINNNLDVLIDEFEGYNKAFEGNLTSALSGGFDTRLMTALILEVGVVPNLYVYGSDDAKDVTVAKAVAEGQGFSLMHINKQDYPQVPLGDFKRVVENNYYDMDCKQDLFAGLSDIDTRKIRSREGGLLLNGSGGEIYRDSWKWSFKSCSLQNIVRNVFYSGQLEGLMVDDKAFFDHIEQKMNSKLAMFFDIGREYTRQQAEMIFPIYRSRFFSSSNTLNSYFGSATFPFMSEPVTLQSFSIPHQFKRYGEFERLLIKKLNPTLASYVSHYGFNFLKGPSFTQKSVERVYSVLPPVVKSHVRSVVGLSTNSFYSEKGDQNPYLENDYFDQIIDLSDLTMSSYVANLSKIKNQKILNRVFSLEYLAAKEEIS